MIQVRNNQTGETETLESDSQLPDLVVAGKVSIPNKDYEFESPEGDKYKVGAQGFLGAIKSGWKYRDSGTLHREELENKYGNETAKALLYGGLRGASLGISDAILTKTGIAEPEELSAIKEFNPIASGVGEVGATIAPILLSGGTGAVGAISKKMLPTLLNEGAEYAGKRAAANITSNVAKNAVQYGVTGMVDGALMGVGQTVSEAALGDKDFNAEALLTNVGTGALIGGGLGTLGGASFEYIKKASKGALSQAKRKIIDSLDIPASEKEALIKQGASDELIERSARIFDEDTEIKAAAERLGLSTPPAGVLSQSSITKGLEASLEDSPSIAGMMVQSETKPFKEEIRKNVSDLVESGVEKTAYQAGEEVKKELFQGINERLRPAQDGLKTIYNTFGEFDVSDRVNTMLSNRIAKSDLYKLSLDKGLVENIQGTLANVKTLNQANLFKKQIGKQLSAEFRKPDRNMAVIDILDDVYSTMSRMEEKAIKDAAKSLGPKTGVKAEKEAMNIYRESMQRYRDIYKDYTPIADQLGIKLKSPDVFLDTLSEIPSEKIQNKILDLNDYDSAKKLKMKYPEIFDIGRKRKLAELAAKIKDPKGDISLKKFVSALEKMSPEQQEILFGFDNKMKQRIADLKKVAKRVPDKINPSGTSINLSFMDMLNPVFQGKELARYAVYKGGDKAIRDYLLKVTPTLAAIEASANKQKNRISSSVNGFFKASGLGVTAGSLDALSDKDVEKAKESYEMVQSNPEALINQYARNNKDLMESAPETANALQQRIVAGVQFLKSKAPYREQTYIGEDLQPSRSELMKFHDYVTAVEKPQVIYDQLKQGYMNPNTLETLRVVYPKTYENIQAEVLAKIPKTLNRAQKIQLQPLLGSKITPAMDYQNLMVLQGKTPGAQQANSQISQQTAQKIPVTGAKNLKASERSATGLDKTLSRT
jgi:hypothetical protein